MAVHIRRDRVFEDSFRELHRRNAEEMKNRLYIVFDGEEGQDAGKKDIHCCYISFQKRKFEILKFYKDV